MRTRRALIPTVTCLTALVLLPGCVRRQLTVTSDPPGALVYLNGEEFGRTPVTRDFTWYGTYDVVLRKEGYETLKTRGKVIAPWWQWVPFDLFAEALPLTDRRSLSYGMTPEAEVRAEPGEMMERAGELRGQLRGTKNTRRPATGPTASTTQPAPSES
jgi:hypothetical protein